MVAFDGQLHTKQSHLERVDGLSPSVGVSAGDCLTVLISGGGGAPAASTGSASDGHLDEETWKKEGFAFSPCLAFALAGEFIYSELQQLLIPSLKTMLFRLPT